MILLEATIDPQSRMSTLIAFCGTEECQSASCQSRDGRHFLGGMTLLGLCTIAYSLSQLLTRKCDPVVSLAV